MRIDLRDVNRRPLFRCEVDLTNPPREAVPPSAEGGRAIEFQWSGALDERRRLRRCPVCGCRELFVRRDFPQKTGLGIVVVAGATSMALFAIGHVLAALAVLMSVVVVDALMYLFTRRCLVCYQCRSEFRGMEIADDLESWDLAAGEKYRVDDR